MCDFGISVDLKRGDWRRYRNLLAGSPAFTPPEQISPHLFDLIPSSENSDGQDKEGEGDEDLSVVLAGDVWSMGVTVYAMLEGHMPFQSENILHLNQLILNHDPPFQRLEELEKDEEVNESEKVSVDMIVKLVREGMLVKDPHKRKTSFHLLNSIQTASNS